MFYIRGSATFNPLRGHPKLRLKGREERGYPKLVTKGDLGWRGLMQIVTLPAKKIMYRF